MLIFGHTGITLGIAQRLQKNVDVRWVAAVSLVQDFIDKPLRYFLLPEFCRGNTRTIAHSLTGTLVLSLMLFALLKFWKVKGARVIALVMPLHLILDVMWHPNMRVSLWWPWLGHEFPMWQEVGLQGLWEHILRDVMQPLNVIGELTGFVILVSLWRYYGLRDQSIRKRVLRTGVLPAP